LRDAGTEVVVAGQFFLEMFCEVVEAALRAQPNAYASGEFVITCNARRHLGLRRCPTVLGKTMIKL
jgi:hypothetical protein